MGTDVFLTRSAAHLPGPAISNDEMEDVLGRVGGQPSRARRVVLRNNGIVSRHYALDRESGRATMSNAQLTAQAIRALGGDLGPVDCLATGTSLPDQLLPNHGVMVHGELGWPRLEVVSLAGICLAGAAAFKHAWLSVKAGEAQRAVATGSELVSPLLAARHFEAESQHRVAQLQERPEIGFEKDFLRWMLSDGAGAVLMERGPAGPCPLRVDWVELSSAAHALPVCMYGGADLDAQGRLQGWASFDSQEWRSQSVFAIKQDVRLLNENIQAATLRDPLAELVQRRKLRAQDIDWFLPHLSSHYFFEPAEEALADAGLPVPRSRWFTNLATRGNTGSASPFIMLDELLRSGRIERGQRLLMFVPESGRFSSGFIHLTAV